MSVKSGKMLVKFFSFSVVCFRHCTTLGFACTGNLYMRFLDVHHVLYYNSLNLICFLLIDYSCVYYDCVVLGTEL